MIVGGAVGLHLIALLLPGNYDIASVLVGVDDSAEVACGAVLEVSRLMFLYALPMRSTLGISELMPLFLDVIFIFNLRGSHSVENMYR
jgi:hypothetical protein